MMNGIQPVTNVGNNDMFNNPIWALVFLAFLGGGGLGFGGNKEQYATSADVQRGFDNNAVVNKLDGITNGLSSLGFTLNNTITQGNFATQSGIADLGYAIKDCCCSIQQSICNQTNTLATAIHAEGEATRGLITTNLLAEKDRQILALQNQAIANSQTSTILNAQGRYVTNPPCPPVCCG